MANITRTPANAAPLLGALTKDGVAGAAGDVLDVVYLDANGDWVPTDASAAATASGRGIVTSTHDGELTFADGDAITVVLLGPMTGFSAMTEGAFGFVSNDEGMLEDAAGTVTQRMGYALRADEFFVLPGVAAPTS